VGATFPLSVNTRFNGGWGTFLVLNGFANVSEGLSLPCGDHGILQYGQDEHAIMIEMGTHLPGCKLASLGRCISHVSGSEIRAQDGAKECKPMDPVPSAEFGYSFGVDFYCWCHVSTSFMA